MCDPACEFSEMRLLAAPPSERITRLGGLGPRRVAGMRGAPGKGVSLGAGPPVITDAGPTSDPAERWGPLVATPQQMAEHAAAGVTQLLIAAASSMR